LQEQNESSGQTKKKRPGGTYVVHSGAMGGQNDDEEIVLDPSVVERGIVGEHLIDEGAETGEARNWVDNVVP
jgi:hypothetical protein